MTVIFERNRRGKKINILIVYTRVSTQNQTLDLQIDRFIQENCRKVFENKISGILSKSERLDSTLKLPSKGADISIFWMRIRDIFWYAIFPIY